MLYEFLTEALAPSETGSVAIAFPAKPRSTSRRWTSPRPKRASQNTLTPADLAPAWRGPPPRKDAKHSI